MNAEKIEDSIISSRSSMGALRYRTRVQRSGESRSAQASAKPQAPVIQGEDMISTFRESGRDPTAAVGSQGNRFWYEWRLSVHTLDANLNTPGTAYAFEAMNRIRRLGAVKYIATQNPLVTLSLVDLVSYIDSLNVSTTNEQQTCITPAIGFRGGKTMTVGQKPYKVNPTEQLSVSVFFPGSNGGYSQAFNPSTIGPTALNWYAQSWLDGVLLRATGA